LARKKAKETQRERIVVFACHRRIELAARDGEKIDAKIVPVPCIGRLNPGIIVRCIEQGASGVLAIGCGDKLCRFESGYLKGLAAFAIARKVAKTLGFQIKNIELTSQDSMSEAVEGFIKRLKPARGDAE
jgi:coenzyme F420-reducing hydrogenase delta subunit